MRPPIKKIRLGLGFLLISTAFNCLSKPEASPAYPFWDPDLTVEERVEDVISRLSLEEKVAQLAYDAPAVNRLHIPAYNWWNEALHGVARAGRATVFPQAIGLAAAWDTSLLHEVASAISDEARAKHHAFVRKEQRGIYQGLTFWSPNINIFRDPRWGRGMETYGEDPFLTGRLSVAFIKGLQGEDARYLKTVATPKHYAVHSGPESDRHTFDAVIDDRDLWETYLPAFRDSIQEGHAQSIMCAYNRFRGEACCGSASLLHHILREEWGFQGYVVSDCGAIRNIYRTHNLVETAAEAASLAVRSGCDLNCGSEYPALLEAIAQGLIGEEEIDTALGRLFTVRIRLGLFDPPERVPYAQIPISVNDSEPHRELALTAARKSIVLLKNQSDLLPLRKDLSCLAVIGPNADDVEILLGNYNGTPSDPVTPLQGIRRLISESTQVIYAPGCPLAEELPLLEIIPESALRHKTTKGEQPGLRGEYFDNRSFQGPPVFSQTDGPIDFNWWDGAPRKGMDVDDFGVRWTGVLVAPVTGMYTIGASAFGGLRFYWDDTLSLEYDSPHHARTVTFQHKLEAGKIYPIRFEYYDHNSDATARLMWSPPQPHLKTEAIQAARRADAAIMFMGISPRLEGEEMDVQVQGFKGGDRIEINLPPIQRELIQSIQKVGKPLVLVLLNGSALAIPWADAHIPAIMEAWYPGQAAGTALAEVLFGDVNPSGRLPVTFYRSLDQLPPFSDYRMQGRTYRYFKADPLYPFGHGLSYTHFAYDNLQLSQTVSAEEPLSFSVDVKNVGSRPGEEVVQLYVSDAKASVPVPIRSLQGFQRIYLEPDQKKTVSFRLKPHQLSLINRNGERMIEAGRYTISIGGKQPGFSGNADAASTEVVSGSIEMKANIILSPSPGIPEN